LEVQHIRRTKIDNEEHQRKKVKMKKVKRKGNLGLLAL
jgi:hypothetical protein